MADRFRLWLAQLNPTVGDLSGNAQMAARPGPRRRPRART
jgi:hypothetical protein